MDIIMPIADLLMAHFDKLKRDGNGTIVYDKQLKEISKNLLNQENLDSTMYHTYDEFFNAVTNGTVESNNDILGNKQENNENQKSSIETLREKIQSIYSKPERNHCIDKIVYGLPKGCKSGYRYVNDVLTSEIWQFWKPGEQVFISAGTGRGKNTFVKKELLKHCGNQKVVIFENRQSLMQQQVIDIISEIDPEALKYNDISRDNMVIFGSYKNIMIISYQLAALKCMLQDSNFLNFCFSARYLFFDEAHYILDDSPYNKGINFFIQKFLYPIIMKNESNNEYKIPSFQNATKIYMSGTMEEIYEYVQLISNFPDNPIDIVKEKEIGDKRGDFFSFGLPRTAQHSQICNSVLSLPTDYSYIQPYKYKTIDDICYQIAQTPINEKWLIFVKSIEEGMKLKSCLQGICNNSVYFLYAENKDDDENAEIYNQLIHKCKFECRVLIATTVIYNGINVNDDAVKHIVVPFAPMSVVKQLIGRKRMSECKTVNVYFPDVTYSEVKKRYDTCIKDCMEVIGLYRNLQLSALCQLNGLVSSTPSKYYYLFPNFFNGYIANMESCLNYPAIYKLYYDTCFYIFVLHRMNPELENPSDFVKILLIHLDIEDKYSDVVDIRVQTKEEKENIAIKELADYLESLTDITIVVPDENGSYEEFLKLKEIINNTYKNLHNENFDTQWKNKERFFSEEKTKIFLSELKLPYEIKSEGSKNKRTITIKKITL